MKAEKFKGIAIFVIVYYTLLLLTVDDVYKFSDVDFLWNRMCQIVDCFNDGVYPFLYYNDFLGVGYGSSIFYGQLTLFPFIPIAMQGEHEFITSYFMVACTLNYFGACSLAKRFTKDYAYIGLLYLISPLMFILLMKTWLYSCFFGVGIGLFFLASCVDIFRDSKPCYKAVILFILLFNTHLVTTIICFLICVCICIYYFDKTKVRQYAKFCILSVLISLYNICNYLIHIDSLRGTTSSSSSFDFNILVYYVLNDFPFKELISYKITDNTLFIGLSLFIAWGIVFFKIKLSIRERVIHCIILIGVILGTKSCWSFIYSHWKVPIQFPVRYLPFLVVVILILTIRRITSSKIKYLLLGVSLMSFLVTSFTLNSVTVDSSTVADTFAYVGNGEYLSSNFIFDADIFKKYSRNVIGDDGKTYNYETNKNILTVDLTNNTSKTITVPKLYYSGYTALSSSDEQLKCSEGYSMFTEIDVSDFTGTLEIYYKQPTLLVLLLIFDYILGLVVFYFTIRKIIHISFIS